MWAYVGPGPSGTGPTAVSGSRPKWARAYCSTGKWVRAQVCQAQMGQGPSGLVPGPVPTKNNMIGRWKIESVRCGMTKKNGPGPYLNGHCRIKADTVYRCGAALLILSELQDCNCIPLPRGAPSEAPHLLASLGFRPQTCQQTSLQTGRQSY